MGKNKRYNRTLHTLKKHFENHGLNFDKVWEKIKDIIIKVVKY